jgi:phosphate transport system protein
MPRETFQQELERLVEEVVDLGREVETCLDTMIEALETNDAEMASRQIGLDSRYKERGTQIAETCLILQARQAPVARDLRLIYTVQAVTNHLVRAGTLCEHICQSIAETADAERDPNLEPTLQEMARGARDLFRQGLETFEVRDIERARDLEAADDKIDLLYLEVMNLAVNPGKDGSGSPEWRVRAALSVHYLERIADHGVDIGERTVFLVTGERMESAMCQYRDRQLDQYND